MIAHLNCYGVDVSYLIVHLLVWVNHYPRQWKLIMMMMICVQMPGLIQNQMNSHYYSLLLNEMISPVILQYT